MKLRSPIIVMIIVSCTACVSNAPAICYNKAKVANRIYDIPVFKKEDGKYLAGYPFYTWTNSSQFTDTSSCDNLKP